MSPRKRPEDSGSRKRSSPAPSAQLAEVRAKLRAAITTLKDLGCEDSMVLVEFWHALDSVNGEAGADP